MLSVGSSVMGRVNRSISERLYGCWELAAQQAEMIFPRLHVKMIRNAADDRFNVIYAANEITLETTEQIAWDSLYQIIVAVRAGHLPEMIGWHLPKYSLRPLWLKGDVSVVMDGGWSVEIPQNLLRQSLDDFCLELFRLGYNSLVLGGKEGADHVSQDIDIPSLIKGLKARGIKVILKPDIHYVGDHTFFNEDFVERCCQDFGDADYILWHSVFDRCSLKKYAPDALVYDSILKEIKVLEASLSKPIIFFLPVINKEQTRWLMRLIDDVKATTTLSFPADNYSIWSMLRGRQMVTKTSLLPIIDGEGFGEGLWPVFTFDRVNDTFAYMQRHNFVGSIVVASQLPQEGSLLDCNLWVAGRRMWYDTDAIMLAERWFRSYWSTCHFNENVSLLRDVSNVVRQLNGLLMVCENDHSEHQRELYRYDIDAILAQLSKWRLDSSRSNDFNDYMNYFINDARRILIHCSQKLKIPSSNLLTEQNDGPGFWTSIEKTTFGGGFSTMVTLLNKPQCLSEVEEMQKIYHSSGKI